jgi:glycosyltransferase involved in cell wall biosynthesis
MISTGRKKILIDLERLKYINTGLGQVCMNFGLEISKIQSERFEFILLVPPRYRNFFGHSVKYESVGLIRKYLPFLCKSYDLWYAIHQDSKYFPSNSKTPYVLTVHDLNFMNEKSKKKAKKRLLKLRRRTSLADSIAVISEYTKWELLKYQDHLFSENIKVIYNGIDVKQYPEAKKPNYIGDRRFVLCLGVIRPKKNQKVLIRFIENLEDDTVLVLAGNKEGNYALEIENEIRVKGLQNQILMPGEVSDEEKYWLYNNAYAVLFPSLFEGMGMPPVEAMRFGKPVFASKSASIPEICKDHAFYWDNFNPNEMVKLYKEKIELFYSDKTYSERAIKFSLNYNWNRNVQEYLNLFEQVLNVHQASCSKTDKEK